MRMLDNVIDLNHYPIPEARDSNLRHRPVGLGLMGFQDALWELGHRLRLGGGGRLRRQQHGGHLLLRHSGLDRAGRRSAAPTPPTRARSGTAVCFPSIRCRCWPRSAARRLTSTWARRSTGSRCGRRCARTACATATPWPSRRRPPSPTSRGVSQSIEPLYTNLYVKSNLSGEFTVVNERLVRDLAERGLWDAEMLDDLKYEDGSVQDIARIPDDLKERYPTAFEIDATWLIACAARRQKWIDMGQSLNLYVAEPSGRLPERSLPLRLAAGPEDDLLPPLARRHAGREIDARRQPPRHPAALDARPQRLGRRRHRAR